MSKNVDYSTLSQLFFCQIYIFSLLCVLTVYIVVWKLIEFENDNSSSVFRTAVKTYKCQLPLDG